MSNWQRTDIEQLQDRLTAVERERDEARAEANDLGEGLAEVQTRLDLARADLEQRDRRIAEFEAALREIKDKPSTAYEWGWLVKQVRDIADAALSPTPAQPATATKEECLGCAKVARHPGEGYVCFMHYEPPAAPPSPAETKPEPLPDTEGRCHFYYGKEGGYCYSAAGDPCPAHGGVISSNHQDEIERLRNALDLIRAWGNAGHSQAVEMQQVAAEVLHPGKFPTPEHIRTQLKAWKEGK